MGKMSKRWLPLEANPDVMSKYIHSLGGPESLSFSDVLACDDWALEAVPRPVYSVVMLFPLKPELEAAAAEQQKQVLKKGQELSKNIWFTKQTISNACGTIGLLHALFNIRDKAPLVKGRFLDSFYERSKNMAPEERAEALEKNEEIEKAHTSVEREGQSHVPDPEEKVDTHFVTFVEVDGCIYELDGRKDFPINHGRCTSNELLQTSVKIVKENFMAKTPNELRYSIIALNGAKG